MDLKDNERATKEIKIDLAHQMGAGGMVNRRVKLTFAQQMIVT